MIHYVTFIFTQHSYIVFTHLGLRLLANQRCLLLWHAQSPDLNPEENCWAHIAQGLVGRSFSNANDLLPGMEKVERATPPSFVQALNSSSPGRVTTVVAKFSPSAFSPSPPANSIFFELSAKSNCSLLNFGVSLRLPGRDFTFGQNFKGPRGAYIWGGGALYLRGGFRFEGSLLT